MLLVFCGVGCGASGGGNARGVSQDRAAGSTKVAPPDDYRLVMNIEDIAGRYVMTTNGFPVTKALVMARTASTRETARMNSALVAGDNTAGVEVVPRIRRSGTELTFGPVAFGLGVQGRRARIIDDRGAVVEGTRISEAQVDSAYAAWKRRVETKWRAYLEREEQGGEAWAADSLEAWIVRHPLEVKTGPFTNEAGPDFSAVFEEAPVIAGTPADSSRLTGYAMHLRSLLAEGDAEALYDEIQPAVSEETGYGSVTVDSNAGREAEIAALREGWNWNANFGRSQIGVRRWSGGRVWELFVRGEDGAVQPFFHNEVTGMNVYVAEIGGELKVVRINA